MNNKLKNLLAIFTMVIGMAVIMMMNNLVHADPYNWAGKSVVPVLTDAGNSYTLGSIGDENAVSSVAHSMHNSNGSYPDVVRVHQYDGSLPFLFNFYMKIPLNAQMQINLSQYLGVKANELNGQDLFVVINNPFARNTPLLLRPQWAFASNVPGGININFDVGAHVEVDARVFGPTDNSVSAPIRYDSSQYVNFHDKLDKNGNWVVGVSPDSLGLGFPNDDQSRTILSYVNFLDGPIAGQKRLTLNVVLSNAAWNSFIDKVNRSRAVGDILFDMYGNNDISVEVMNHLFGFEDDMLNSHKHGVSSLAINPAPSRSTQPIIDAPTIITPNPINDSIQIIADPVLPPVTLIPQLPIPTVSTVQQRPVAKPSFSLSSGIPDEETLEVFRVYNPNNGMHHYTMNKGEVDSLLTLGWRDEGVAFKCSANGVPVYRLYNPNDGTHHYTMDENEKNHLANQGWNDEGIAWYAKIEGDVPVFRIYNPGNGEHVWTTNYAEVENAVAHGWRNEGIAWYIE